MWWLMSIVAGCVSVDDVLAHQGDPEQGYRVFNQSCNTCHRAVWMDERLTERKIVRRMIEGVGPDGVYQVHGVIPPEGEKGRTMPAFSDYLTDVQMASVAAYLVDGIAEVHDSVAMVPDRNEGEVLFDQLCAECHAVEDLPNDLYVEEVVEAALFGTYWLGQQRSPAFDDVLTPQDARDVAAAVLLR